MKKVLVLVLLCLAPSMSFTQDLLVAAAADLNFALPEIAARYQQKTGKKVAFTFGSSGNFYQQIRNGAPFDMFFSADEGYPAKLQHEGFAAPGTLYTYAVGRLVLYVPSSSKLDLSQGLKVLLSPEIRKIAIANPQHAPYGHAAMQALTSQGLYDRVKDKLVLGENISQTAQFVESENADIGIIALSLASAPAMRAKGRFLEVPPADYAPLRQAVIVIKTAPHQQNAKEFLEFLERPDILELLSQYGFARP